MRAPITGSKIHRIWKCPASAVLPQIDSEDSSPAARRGQEIHAYLERVHLVGPEVALGECSDPTLTPLLRALDLDLLPVGLATEVAYAWNWQTRTARELGRNLGRAYTTATTPPDPITEIAITVDVVGAKPSQNIGYVGDYKTGHGKLPAPDRFGQLLLGALCARAVYGLDECVVELLHIHSDGDHHANRRTVDSWDLDAFAEELYGAMTLVSHWEAEYTAGRGVDAHEGSHCGYCPAYNQCPAKTALIRQLPGELAALGVGAATEIGGPLVIGPGAINVRNAADVWMLLERLSDVIDRAKAEICGMAAFEAIPLPDGRVIGRLQTERRAIDGRVGAEVLEERYGRATRDKYVELKLSLSAVQQAVVANLKPGEKCQTRKGDGVMDRVLAEIERRGGIGINSTDSVKPHVPKKRLKSA